MKICTKCSNEKPETDYYLKDKASGRLHTQCKSCYKLHRLSYASSHYEKYGDAYRARARERRNRVRHIRREQMLTYLRNKSCVLCGEGDIRTLEFDHLDPSKKSFGIAKAMADGLAWERISKEIEKCRILCANCHKKHTAEQVGWYRLI